MIKSRLRFMAIIGLMMALVLFAIGRVNTVAYINGDSGISPKPSAFRIETPLYYVNENYLLESEKRPIVIKNNDVTSAVLTALKRAPENESLKPILDPAVRVLSAEINEKKLYLNLSGEVMNGNLWKIGYHDVIIYGIVNSLTQFESIERIQIKIDGQEIKSYLGSAPILSEYSFNEQLVFKPPQSPRDVVQTFLNYTMLERYDLAYQMTTAYAELEMNDSGFTQYMRSYRNNKLIYQISNILVNEMENGEIMVLVYYKYIDRVRNISFDGGYETWYLLKDEEGYYKIRWKDQGDVVP